MTGVPLGVVVAALGGLAIGLERQWSGHASGPNARFAGIRTFTLLGGAAGLAGWLWTGGVTTLAAILLAAAAALVVAAYVAASRSDIDATTEVSALVVLATGVLAGIGHVTLASGIIAIATLMLVEKSALHRFAARLDDEGLRAAARFAVMAAVVLPLLPAGPYGPWDTVRPRDLWLLVLFFSGLSFAGYLARRAVGPRHGHTVAGLLGGLISSTSVAFTFSRMSRLTPALAPSLASGVVAACTVLFLRVGVATAVLHPPLLRPLVWYLWPPFVVGAVAVYLAQRRAHRHAVHLATPPNPLQLGAALQMALLFQAVLMGVALVRHAWGDAGVVWSGAVLGLTDVDALTVSMAKAAAADLPLTLAARGLATGLLANTVLKAGLAVALGGARFRGVVGVSLAAMSVVLAVLLAGLG